MTHSPHYENWSLGRCVSVYRSLPPLTLVLLEFVVASLLVFIDLSLLGIRLVALSVLGVFVDDGNFWLGSVCVNVWRLLFV